MAEALQEGEEAQGLADAAEGDVEGAVIGGGIEEAVQAGIEQGQLFQDGVLLGLVRLAALRLKLAGEVLAVAAEGRSGKLIFFGQSAIRHRGPEAQVDLRAGGVRADGTTFDHTCAPREEFPQKAGWVTGYQGRGGGARADGKNDEETYAREKFMR